MFGLNVCATLTSQPRPDHQMVMRSAALSLMLVQTKVTSPQPPLHDGFLQRVPLPKDLYAFLATSHVPEGVRCGVCRDCTVTLPSAPAKTGAVVRAEVYAVDPQLSNIEVLEGYAKHLSSRGEHGGLFTYHLGFAKKMASELSKLLRALFSE